MDNKNKGKQPSTPQSAKTSAAQAPDANPNTVVPKITMKGERVFQHHLFLSDVAKCKKNTSYEPDQPMLVDMEHKHVFHTIDSKGRKQLISSHALGHFHQMSWGMDSEGNLYAKSGPALRKVAKHLRDGSVQMVDSPIFWTDLQDQRYNDEHTHSWEYQHTEEFTAKSLASQRKANQEELIENGVDPNQTPRPLQQAAPFTSDDPAVIREGSTL